MNWPWRKRREKDLERELGSHLELETEEQQDTGLSSEEARYAARRAFGNAGLVRDEVRDLWTWARADALAKDLRYSVRSIRKNPGFAATAILTLALGIGANTAIFSIMDAVLLRPLPYPRPDRLIRIWQSEPKMSARRLGTAPPEFVAYRDRTRMFSSLAGYQEASFDVTNENHPEHIPACQATASLFPTLGVSALIGRVFTAQEESIGAGKVVVLSHRYWKNRYNGDPGVLGRTIRLNEQPYEVIGVMPEGFAFPATKATPGEPSALWTPLWFTKDELLDWASSFDTSIVARLRDDASLSLAREDVQRVAKQFQREHPDIYSGNVVLDATAEHWSPDLGERIRTVLFMLCGAVGFVLLIACANVANLLLARAGARQREISIRHALGASASRLMRQVFSETAVLAFIGGGAGCALAYALIRIIETLWMNDVNLAAVSVDWRVLLFTLGLSAVTCLLCGLAPAWTARKPDINDALIRTARQSGPSLGQRRLARSLILAEIACSVVLLVGSGLLFRSFVHVLQIPLGFDPEHTLIVRTELNRQRYGSAERRHEVEGSIAGRLSSLPGVEAVAVTSHVPLADERQIGFLIDGAPPDEFHWADNALVSGDYFRVMRIPLLRGRSFTDRDAPHSPLAAVINESMAREYWHDDDPVGKGFKWGGRHLTVIGVAGDIHAEALDKPIGPAIYNSLYQVESGATTSGVFVLRMRGGNDPMRLAAAAQNEIWSVDHALPILGFSTLHQVVSASLATRRASLSLAADFALLALVLSLIGVYGVLSHSVTQRTREMGLRMAMGARPIENIKLVMGEGARLTVWGIVVGLGAAGIASASVSKLLFGVRTLDPISYFAGAALLLAVSLAASYLPARRASRVDPMTALREE
ncbi:MAG: ABC transporter permease [Acidobacteriaceae bacterium]|nr:ABC transporter permease [Acidobacteriaceae bacterium]